MACWGLRSACAGKGAWTFEKVVTTNLGKNQSSQKLQFVKAGKKQPS
jgi:hypothetical protein